MRSNQMRMLSVALTTAVFTSMVGVASAAAGDTPSVPNAGSTAAPAASAVPAAPAVPAVPAVPGEASKTTEVSVSKTESGPAAKPLSLESAAPKASEAKASEAKSADGKAHATSHSSSTVNIQCAVEKKSDGSSSQTSKSISIPVSASSNASEIKLELEKKAAKTLKLGNGDTIKIEGLKIDGKDQEWKLELENNLKSLKGSTINIDGKDYKVVDGSKDSSKNNSSTIKVVGGDSSSSKSYSSELPNSDTGAGTKIAVSLAAVTLAGAALYFSNRRRAGQRG